MRPPLRTSPARRVYLSQRLIPDLDRGFRFEDTAAQVNSDPLVELAYPIDVSHVGRERRFCGMLQLVSEERDSLTHSLACVNGHSQPSHATAVSVGGGYGPAWNPNGRELFYVTTPRANAKQAMMAVEFVPGQPPIPGRPRALFDIEPGATGFGGTPNIGFAVARDGEHFFTMTRPKTPPPPPVTHINIIPNWFAELKGKVPVR